MALIPHASTISFVLVRFDFSTFFSGCGRDVMNFVFESCPMGALARFAGTCHGAREGVQDYIRLRIYRNLKPFLGPENLITFLNLLAENHSAIVGSVALKIMLNGCGSNWAPRDLNVAVPYGGLPSFSHFLRGLHYQLSGTGVRSRFIDGAFTHSIYVNPGGNVVTVTEALSSDSFFSVVVGSGHTALMNFVSSEHLGCLYPTQTLKDHVAYAYRRSLGVDAHHNLRIRGFDIITSSDHHPPHNSFLCPVAHRQLSAFSGIGLFEWTKRITPSNFLTRSYSWSLGDECLNYGCLVKALEQYLKRRKCVSDE